MIKKILTLLFFVMALTPMTASAFGDPDGPKVEARLIAQVETVQAGQPFTVAVQQIITPNWHTYWKNPGDSGLPTTIKWDLPSGARAGEIIWPTPSRYEAAGLINYGYSNEVLLLTEIMPPDTLVPGSVLTIKADVDWLACEEICIPESAEVSLSLPVTDQAGGLSQEAAKFDQARQSVPTETDTKAIIEIGQASHEFFLEGVNTLISSPITEAYFYNIDGVSIAHSLNQDFSVSEDTLSVSLVPGSNPLREGKTLKGVLALKGEGGDTQSFYMEADIVAKTAEAAVPAVSLNQSETGSTSLLMAVILAFLGGLALNLMPCVFPVLSMKALSLVNHAHHEDKKYVKLNGLMYLLGVLVTFTALALFIIALRAAGEKVGWGAQLQSPAFVLVTAYVLFVVGYALSGALNVGSSLIGVGSKWAERHGLTGSFFTGVLAVIVATPCTAPFMGAAIFYALTQPWHISMLVIQALGFGLALPYLILTFNPRLLSLFPKPGVWMENFKQFLAFPMFGAAIWLVWVLSLQVGSSGVMLSLGGMALIAFGLWLFGTLATDKRKGLWHAIKIVLCVVSILIALSFTQTVRMLYTTESDCESPISVTGGLVSEIYSPEQVERARAQGKPVLINMTAAWCITCLANERIAFQADEVKEFFKEHDIAYFKGDWTNRDPVITSYIKSFGRSGVPLYVYYPPAGEGVILPQLLTSDILLSKIKKAGL